MTDNPLISVVIATHNYARFLPECLTSVKCQTYDNYELIVVDNGSTDNTKEVIKNLAWDKLHYHYQNNTGSVAGPRNTGIRLAKGKYVAFLDSDDFWYSQKLKKTVEILKNDPKIDILSHHMWVNGGGRILVKVGPLKKNMFRFLLTLNRLLGSATVVKKDILTKINGFDERKDFVHVEDYETWLRIAAVGGKFAFINEALGEFRIHESNLSHDFERALSNEVKVIDKHFSNFKCRIPFCKLFLKSISLSRIFLTMGVKQFLQKQYAKGFFNIVKSFFINPTLVLRFLCSSFYKIPAKLYEWVTFKHRRN